MQFDDKTIEVLESFDATIHFVLRPDKNMQWQASVIDKVTGSVVYGEGLAGTELEASRIAIDATVKGGKPKTAAERIRDLEIENAKLKGEKPPEPLPEPTKPTPSRKRATQGNPVNTVRI